MKKFLLLAAIIFVPSVLFAGGLNTLIQVGKAQKEIANSAAEETKSFDKVKNAVDNGRLKPGQSKDSIKKEYGEPVIDFAKTEKEKETWIYKSAKATFFDGEKVYLIFDDNGNLEETKVVNRPAQSAKAAEVSLPKEDEHLKTPPGQKRAGSNYTHKGKAAGKRGR